MLVVDDKKLTNTLIDYSGFTGIYYRVSYWVVSVTENRVQCTIMVLAAFNKTNITVSECMLVDCTAALYYAQVVSIAYVAKIKLCIIIGL